MTNQLGSFSGQRGAHLAQIAPPATLFGYNPAMTFMTVTYELQEKLRADQFRALGQFANTYGLQKFRFDEKTNLLHFDYDASRLRESVVEHVLREARIPVLRRVPNA
jgi:hypothetical protein